MNREWKKPEIAEVNVSATAYAPQGGPVEDGVTYDAKGNKLPFLSTFGPSEGNTGVPTLK